MDGRDIKDYNPLWLRYHIGFVSQDDATIFFFFSRSCVSCFFWLCSFSWNDFVSPKSHFPCDETETHGGRDIRLATCNGEDLVLCNRTIRENLLYGCDSEPNDADARQALRAAQCEDGWFLEVGVVLGW